jgi:hypothetical protein
MGSQARVIFRFIVALTWIWSGATAHASCKPFEQSDLAHAPMDVAVIAELEDPELKKDVAYLNNHQSHYRLTLLEGEGIWSQIQASLGYDVIVAVDREMMKDGKPKYNQYLTSYRDEDVSDHTMFIDFESNDKQEIVFAFIQISAANAKARSRLMELGLLAVARRGWAFEPEVQGYISRLDEIVEQENAKLSASAITDIDRARDAVVGDCFSKVR